jgi:hypothetical protein
VPPVLFAVPEQPRHRRGDVERQSGWHPTTIGFVRGRALRGELASAHRPEPASARSRRATPRNRGADDLGAVRVQPLAAAPVRAVERRHRGTAQPGFTCHSADRPGRARWRLGAVSARALYARALLWWAFACAVVTTLRGGGHTFRMAYNWPEAIAIWLPVALFAAAAVATIVAADATRGERLRPAHREPAGADPRTRSWVGAWVLGLGGLGLGAWGLGARGSAARQIARSPDRSTDLQI